MAAWKKQADAAKAAKKADEAAAEAAKKADSGAADSGGGGGGGSGASCPVSNSFTPETKVFLADGTTKAIKDLKPGDKVQATDPETGKTEAKSVDATIKGKGAKHLVKVTVDVDGAKGAKTSTVTATDGHPFWVPELAEWIDATDLNPGQWLQTGAGTRIQITAIQRWTHQATVHNLTVGDFHTYYVLAGVTPILVHNCGESKWTPDENCLPEAVAARSAANKAYYEIPQDIHDLVSDVVSNPNYPQRMTGPAGNRRPDVYGAHGAPRAAQRWRGSTIYDNGDPLSQARILVDGNGNIAYVGRSRDGSHNYNQIIPYPWATRP